MVDLKRAEVRELAEFLFNSLRWFGTLPEPESEDLDSYERADDIDEIAENWVYNKRSMNAIRGY